MRPTEGLFKLVPLALADHMRQFLGQQRYDDVAPMIEGLADCKVTRLQAPAPAPAPAEEPTPCDSGQQDSPLEREQPSKQREQPSPAVVALEQ